MPSLSKHTFPRSVQAIRVAPGTEVLPPDVRTIPALGVFEWKRQPDGSYLPVVRVRDAWLRVSEAEKLPLGLSAEVIIKLVKGGFVIGSQAAPNNIMVNVNSLLEHIEECSEDPDYWTTERRNRFRDGM